MRMLRAALVFAHVALLAAAAQSQTRRPTPRPTPDINQWPSVKLVSAADRVVLPTCPEAANTHPACKATSPKVGLHAQATDPDGDTLLYTYSTTGGRIDGEGPEVTLDLTGLAPGTYTVTVEVDDGNGGIATGDTKVTVERCSCPLPPPTPRRARRLNLR
jgi:hypothetical protein